jgi:hypothetical protein
MKKSVSLFAAISIIIFLGGSCKNTTTKNNVPGTAATTTPVEEGLILIGRDIITEVVVKPDTLGDPWEVEKVKGYNGKEMFASLFENIKNKKVTVYDCFTGAALDPSDVMKMKNEIGTDISKIGKIQFLEDWYFNPLTNSISKKIKSASFGYETIREGGLPTGYTALFQLKTK